MYCRCLGWNQASEPVRVQTREEEAKVPFSLTISSPGPRAGGYPGR
jgi:hypothetical protein